MKRVLLAEGDCCQVLGRVMKVFNKLGPHAVAAGFLRCAENSRRVIRRGQPDLLVTLEEFTSMLRQPEIAAEHGLSGRGAHADDDLGFDDEDFGLQPGPARLDLPPGGFFVQAAFAARLPTKVFYRVCNVNVVARNTRLVERFIKQPACRTDERLALFVFLVAGHFAKQNDVGSPRTFAEDRLRGVFVEIAAAAMLGRLAKGFQI
jgi:hypothetical protein